MEIKQKQNQIRSLLKTYQDFPKKGIRFYDIMPILAQPNAFKNCIQLMADSIKNIKAKYIVGLQSRGFLLGLPLAQKLNIGFIPIRKKGKLPGKVISKQYDLQYGKDCIQIQDGTIKQGQSIVICDDLLATGGTLCGAIQLLRETGAKIEAISILIDLKMQGKYKDKLQQYKKIIKVTFNIQ